MWVLSPLYSLELESNFLTDLLILRMEPAWMWLLRGFGIIDRKLTLMLRFSTPWLLLMVLLHFLSVIRRWAELEKRRMYEERIREIEHGSFIPLVFSCSGGMGPLVATIVYKRLASLISEKSSQTYSMTLYWLRCKLSFSLLHSATTCLRGSRSSYHCFRFSDTAINLACTESHLELNDN